MPFPRIDRFDRQIAVVIGVTAYRCERFELENAVPDADAISKVLGERHGYQVHDLRDEQATQGGARPAVRPRAADDGHCAVAAADLLRRPRPGTRELGSRSRRLSAAGGRDSRSAQLEREVFQLLLALLVTGEHIELVQSRLLGITPPSLRPAAWAAAVGIERLRGRASLVLAVRSDTEPHFLGRRSLGSVLDEVWGRGASSCRR